jgi:hypothetical protein
LQADPGPCTAYILGLHLRERLVYHPGGRYWRFQLEESALYLALGLGLVAFSRWRVRRIA